MASHPLLAALNREWRELADQAQPWTMVRGETFGDLLVTIRTDPDATLGVLLGLSLAGDARAGRVVLQTMLGKLVLMAARDRDHDLSDYVAECWLTLAQYPLARRPKSIAANLAFDTRKRVRRLAMSKHLGVPESASPPRPTDELAPVLREAQRLGLVDPPTRACLEAVYRDGLRSHEAAVVLGMSAAMVRYRTSRAVRVLARHATALAAA